LKNIFLYSSIYSSFSTSFYNVVGLLQGIYDTSVKRPLCRQCEPEASVQCDAIRRDSIGFDSLRFDYWFEHRSFIWLYACSYLFFFDWATALPSAADCRRSEG